MTNIKLGDLCKSCAGQIKVEDGELIDYIDISSIDNEKKETDRISNNAIWRITK